MGSGAFDFYEFIFISKRGNIYYSCMWKRLKNLPAVGERKAVFKQDTHMSLLLSQGSFCSSLPTVKCWIISWDSHNKVFQLSIYNTYQLHCKRYISLLETVHSVRAMKRGKRHEHWNQSPTVTFSASIFILSTLFLAPYEQSVRKHRLSFTAFEKNTELLALQYIINTAHK